MQASRENEIDSYGDTDQDGEDKEIPVPVVYAQDSNCQGTADHKPQGFEQDSKGNGYHERHQNPRVTAGFEFSKEILFP